LPTMAMLKEDLKSVIYSRGGHVLQKAPGWTKKRKLWVCACGWGGKGRKWMDAKRHLGGNVAGWKRSQEIRQMMNITLPAVARLLNRADFREVIAKALATELFKHKKEIKIISYDLTPVRE